jgi:hypothetical protein
VCRSDVVQAVWKSALRVQKHKPGYIKLPLSIFHDFAARCIVIQALAGVRQLALLMGMESLSDFCCCDMLHASVLQPGGSCRNFRA